MANTTSNTTTNSSATVTTTTLNASTTSSVNSSTGLTTITFQLPKTMDINAPTTPITIQFPTQLERRRPRPSLDPIFTRLRFPLAAIRPEPTVLGDPPHPSFPATLLEYHLLSEEELDSMAVFYHQNPSSPTIWTYSYPENMDWDPEFLAHVGETKGYKERIKIKRRKFGRFIGLRGCDTPVEEADEKSAFLRRRAQRRLKASDMGFWGRRGYGRW